MIDPNPTAETLITGDASKNLHLNTVEDVDCVHCYDEAFFGMPVDQVSKTFFLFLDHTYQHQHSFFVQTWVIQN